MTGIRYAAGPGAILRAVQLYTSVRQQQQQQQQENPVPLPARADIDRLIAMQRFQAFVGTGPPSSPQAHFKNYCRSRGVSPANWLAAANRRKGKRGKVLVRMSRAGICELKFRAPASWWCASRVGKLATAGPARRPWTAEIVQQVLEASDWFKMQEEESAEKDGAAANKSEAGAAAYSKTKAKAKGAPARPTPGAPQLMRHVAHVIQAEISELLFNYFTMHDTVQGLLEQARGQADDIGLPSMSFAMTADVADFVGLV